MVPPLDDFHRLPPLVTDPENPGSRRSSEQSAISVLQKGDISLYRMSAPSCLASLPVSASSPSTIRMIDSLSPNMGSALPFRSPSFGSLAYGLPETASQCETLASPASSPTTSTSSKRASWNATNSRSGTGTTISSSKHGTKALNMKKPGGSCKSWVRDSDADAMSMRSNSSSGSSSHSVVMPQTPTEYLFLPNRIATTSVKGCSIRVDDSSLSEYKVACRLPGFAYENVTVALKRNGDLHIIADKFEDPPLPLQTPSMSKRSLNGLSTPDTEAVPKARGEHYERMVELGDDAIGGKARASWDDRQNLTVHVSRRQLGQWQAKTLPKDQSQRSSPS